jgi:4-hydroxy-tetrahydrodipicolinate synthase
MVDQRVDFERLRELVEFHILAGTQGLVAAGTTGESGTLTCEEKKRVIQAVVEQARERVPVIAGTSANATSDAIELTQAAMHFGADAVLIMTPAYIKPTQEGLYQHYSRIAHAVPIPLILYNVPHRTGCDLLPKTVARLSHCSNIVGIKDATGDVVRLQHLIEAGEGRVDVFSGDDLTAAEWMLAGAKGVISVTANVAASHMVELCAAAAANDVALSRRLQEQLMPLHQLMFVESNPIPVKWAVSRMGLMGDSIRLPLTRLSVEYYPALEQVMQELNVI